MEEKSDPSGRLRGSIRLNKEPHRSRYTENEDIDELNIRGRNRESSLEKVKAHLLRLEEQISLAWSNLNSSSPLYERISADLIQSESAVNQIRSQVLDYPNSKFNSSRRREHRSSHYHEQQSSNLYFVHEPCNIRADQRGATLSEVNANYQDEEYGYPRDRSARVPAHRAFSRVPPIESFVQMPQPAPYCHQNSGSSWSWSSSPMRSRVEIKTLRHRAGSISRLVEASPRRLRTLEEASVSKRREKLAEFSLPEELMNANEPNQHQCLYHSRSPIHVPSSLRFPTCTTPSVTSISEITSTGQIYGQTSSNATQIGLHYPTNVPDCSYTAVSNSSSSTSDCSSRSSLRFPNQDQDHGQDEDGDGDGDGDGNWNRNLDELPRTRTKLESCHDQTQIISSIGLPITSDNIHLEPSIYLRGSNKFVSRDQSKARSILTGRTKNHQYLSSPSLSISPSPSSTSSRKLFEHSTEDRDDRGWRICDLSNEERPVRGPTHRYSDRIYLIDQNDGQLAQNLSYNEDFMQYFPKKYSKRSREDKMAVSRSDLSLPPSKTRQSHNSAMRRHLDKSQRKNRHKPILDNQYSTKLPQYVNVTEKGDRIVHDFAQHDPFRDFIGSDNFDRIPTPETAHSFVQTSSQVPSTQLESIQSGLINQMEPTTSDIKDLVSNKDDSGRRYLLIEPRVSSTTSSSSSPNLNEQSCLEQLEVKLSCSRGSLRRYRPIELPDESGRTSVESVSSFREVSREQGDDYGLSQSFESLLRLSSFENKLSRSEQQLIIDRFERKTKDSDNNNNNNYHHQHNVYSNDNYHSNHQTEENKSKLDEIGESEAREDGDESSLTKVCCSEQIEADLASEGRQSVDPKISIDKDEKAISIEQAKQEMFILSSFNSQSSCVSDENSNGYPINSGSPRNQADSEIGEDSFGLRCSEKNDLSFEQEKQNLEENFEIQGNEMPEELSTNFYLNKNNELSAINKLKRSSSSCDNIRYVSRSTQTSFEKSSESAQKIDNINEQDKSGQDISASKQTESSIFGSFTQLFKYQPSKLVEQSPKSPGSDHSPKTLFRNHSDSEHTASGASWLGFVSRSGTPVNSETSEQAPPVTAASFGRSILGVIRNVSSSLTSSQPSSSPQNQANKQDVIRASVTPTVLEPVDELCVSDGTMNVHDDNGTACRSSRLRESFRRSRLMQQRLSTSDQSEDSSTISTALSSVTLRPTVDTSKLNNGPTRNESFSGDSGFSEASSSVIKPRATSRVQQNAPILNHQNPDAKFENRFRSTLMKRARDECDQVEKNFSELESGEGEDCDSLRFRHDNREKLIDSSKPTLHEQDSRTKWLVAAVSNPISISI